MESKKLTILGLIIIILVGGYLLFGDELLTQDAEIVEEVEEVEEQEENIEEPEEEGEEAPQAYQDLLEKARDESRNNNYQAAVTTLMQAFEIYEDSRGYTYLYVAYDFLGNIEGKRDALHKVLYEFGLLDSGLWREYAIVSRQLGATDSEMIQIYEDAVVAMERLAGAGSTSQLVDAYTMYAAFLGGIGQNQAAIDKLLLAKELDPARGYIFDAEIESLTEGL